MIGWFTEIVSGIDINHQKVGVGPKRGLGGINSLQGTTIEAKVPLKHPFHP